MLKIYLSANLVVLLILHKVKWHVHVATSSNDGTVNSFGRNKDGKLGLGHKYEVSLPTPIPNLPKIKM